MSTVRFWWLGAGFLTAAILLQATFGEWFRLFSAAPDLLLVILVWFSLQLSLPSALTLGMAASFLKMAASGEPSLLIFLSLTGSAGLSHWIARKLMKEVFFIQLGILAVLCLAVYGVSFFWIHPFHSLKSVIGFFISGVLLTTLFTVCAAPWIWRRLDKLLKRWGWDSSTESV